MNPTPLFHADGRSAGVYYCGKCRLMYRSGELELAQQCCLPKICECGKECEKYWTICRECLDAKHEAKDAARYAAAAKIAPEAFDGMVYNDDDELFHDDAYEAVEAWYDDREEDDPRPPRLYACTSKRMALDVEQMLEHALEEFHEDARDEIPAEAAGELERYLHAWCQTYGPVSWYPDYSRAILPPPNPFVERSGGPIPVDPREHPVPPQLEEA